ncbi:hypothetical protein [Streptomyces sp. MS2.AVA.5]|uniref:Uncharacterized protein n=1 Tax=Streptomyces achmelvichensis TaxID=3134111 RepID=A0ACC6PLC1_9ACTN
MGKTVSTFEERFCAATPGRLSAATRFRLDNLIAEDRARTERVAGARSSPSWRRTRVRWGWGWTGWRR